MSDAARQPMTRAEFLEWEERQELRFEYDGLGPVAMASGTAAHDRITLNLAVALVPRLRGSPCQPNGSNLKVEVQGHIRYPGGYITCTPQAPGATMATDPMVIFEILSKGTARRDRVEKNREYRATASVTHYVMLEQGEIAATVMTRRQDEWVTMLLGAAEMLELPNVGVVIPLLEFYQGVEFADADES